MLKMFKSRALRISVISILVNAALSAVKMLGGLFGHSSALVADAVHSLSDVLSTFVVIAALIISRKAPDRDHEYGHQRYESIASLLLAVLLAYTGVKIGMSGVQSIIKGDYLHAQMPSMLTAGAAALSIITKEVMYRITMATAVKEKSSSLKADAHHHRSDALSSVGSLIGIVLAKFGLPAADPVASAVIAIMIIKSAYDIAADAVKALTDSACDDTMTDAICSEITDIDGVVRIDSLKTRLFGSGYYADIEIAVDGSMSLESAHTIAEAVHDRIEHDFPDIWHCMVHVNPAEEHAPQVDKKITSVT